MYWIKIMNPKFHLIFSSFLIGLALIGNTSGEIYFKKGAPHVQLASKALLSGIVQFSRDGRPFSTFAGIPYATVPERFAESEVITTKQWNGVKSVIQSGPMCPQKMMPPSLGTYVGEEDCLFLDVHVPMNNTGKKGYPVMMWIHGGGFVFGTGAMYGPKYFMDEDVILVTINYRLGVFGFLSTGDDIMPGNQGLKDQVNALRWIQENIRKFGGDPGKVTIFGESAGGASVHLLTLSPLTKGLFSRAIAQSGTALSTWANDVNPKKSAEKLAKHLGCPTGSSEEIVKCLREKSKEELNEAQFSFDSWFPNNLIPLFFGPTTEPETSKMPLITQSPWSLLTDKTSKLFNDVPIMIGLAEHEGVHLYSSVVMGNEDLIKDLNDNWDTIAPNAFVLEKAITCPEGLKKVTDKIRKFYFKADPISKEKEAKMTDLYSDSFFLHSIHRTAIETALRSTTKSKKTQVYFYQYAHQSKFALMSMLIGGENVDASKVGHADELPFQFNIQGIPETDVLVAPDSEDEAFSKNLVRLWASFARHGEPKHVWGNVGRWNPISKEEASGTQSLQILKLDNEPKIIEDKVYQERILFWNAIWEEHVLKAGKKDEVKAKTEL